MNEYIYIYIRNTIKELKNKNSSGYDEIPTSKISTPYIISPLTYIIIYDIIYRYISLKNKICPNKSYI
jgi:hypothetical protein